MNELSKVLTIFTGSIGQQKSFAQIFDQVILPMDLRRFVVVPIAKLLNSLTRFFEHILGYGDYQSHVRRIVETLKCKQLLEIKRRE